MILDGHVWGVLRNYSSAHLVVLNHDFVKKKSETPWNAIAEKENWGSPAEVVIIHI